MYFPQKNAVPLEFPQLFSQHARRDTGQVAAQFEIAPALSRKKSDNADLPAALDDLESVLRRAERRCSRSDVSHANLQRTTL